MSSQSENIAEAQREVERKLGRNLLRIQQLEVMVKSMLATRVIETGSGDGDDGFSYMNKRKQDVAKKTLGQAVGDLTTDYFSQLENEAGQSLEDNEDQGRQLSEDKAFVRSSFRVEMSPEDYQRTRQRLAELVELRNELVHHFIEIHDIRTVAGCASADAYLDACFRSIDERFEELNNFAQTRHKLLEDSIRNFRVLLKSPEMEDWRKHGIRPAGAGVEWASCTIVDLLRDAEAALAVDEWVPLTKAIEYISSREPSHTPKRYGCSSWRQVLHNSGMFFIRRERSMLGFVKETWYRSRSEEEIMERYRRLAEQQRQVSIGFEIEEGHPTNGAGE